MTKIHDSWTVLPHGPLVEADDGILTVTGQIPMPLVELERRMTVVRLNDGGLVIYSAIALDDAHMAQIEMLGAPRFLIVPGDAHRLDAKIYKKRYPDLQVIAPEGARYRVALAVPVDDDKADFGDPAVRLENVPGTGNREAALLVRRTAGTTLVLNDLIANLRRRNGFEGWLLHMMGFGGDRPEIPRVSKMALIDHKKNVQQQLLAWAADPALKRILVSHGEPIDNPAQVLNALAQTLA